MLTFALFVLGYVATLAAIAATAWAAGQLAASGLTAWRTRTSSSVSTERRSDISDSAGVDARHVPWAVTMACGLAILSHATLLIGLIGWLYVPVLVAIVIGLHLAAIEYWRRAAVRARRVLADAGPRVFLWSTATAALLLPSFLLTLYPPIGFDETMYHLPYARAFAASGSLPVLPAIRFPLFPQLAEALNAAVLLLAGDVATHLVGWLACIATVGLVWTWARELSFAHDDGRAGAWTAATMLAGSPIMIYVASAGFIDPQVALFGTASLYCTERAGRDVSHARDASLGWIVAAGALAGSAASTKYLGIYFVPVAAMLLVWRRLASRVRSHDGDTVPTLPSTTSSLTRDLMLYGVTALLVTAPTYGRLVAHTGNPVFPFYPELFGMSVWYAPEFLGPRGIDRLLAATTLVWDAAFHRHEVGALPHLSPAFALGFPVALLAAWRRPVLRPLLIIAVGYLVVAPVNSRYFLVIAPLWAVLIGASAAVVIEPLASARRDAGERSGKQSGSLWIGQHLFMGVAATLALGGEAYCLYRLYQLGLPPATSAARERLLETQLPLYSAVAFVNRSAGPATIYGVNAERMVDYAAGTFVGDLNGPASYARVTARAEALGSLASALDEVGATYLVVPDGSASWTERVRTDSRFERIYEDEHATVYRVLPSLASPTRP